MDVGKFDNRWFFNLTAGAYDFLTHQDVWRRQVRQTLDLVDDPSTSKRVLDLGCGPGLSSFVLAECLPDAQVIGVDISDEMITRARRHHRDRYADLENLEFRRANVYDLSTLTRSFDLAVGHSFLYLLPDRTAALEAIIEVLDDEAGRLVLLEPNAGGSLLQAAKGASFQPFLRTPVGAARFAVSMTTWRLVSGRQGRMTGDELRAIFSKAGFQQIAVRETLGGLGLHVAGVTR